MNPNLTARVVLLLALFVVAFSTAAAQTQSANVQSTASASNQAQPASSTRSKSRGWMRGRWEGTGYQIDDKSTWAMVVTAGTRRVLIDYPSLNCGGHWKMISMSAGRARFREILDRGQEKCADKGSVLIQRLNRNQLMFAYSYQGARAISASAILTRAR